LNLEPDPWRMKLPNQDGATAWRREGLATEPWKIPLSLAAALHLAALAAAIFMPSIFHQRSVLPEIYTVNLFNATEVAQRLLPAEPAAPASRPETATISTARVNIKPVIEKSQPAPAPPAISIAPDKRKSKRLEPKKPAADPAAQRAMVADKLRRLQAELELKEAREKADRAAREAVAKLRQSLAHSTAGPPAAATAKKDTGTAGTGAAPAGPAGAGVEMDEATKQYYAAVYQRIHEHWILPDIPEWGDNLEAVLIIKIRRDGVVANSFFESKSDNVYFNQFVTKTLREAAPLPPFPPRLDKSFIEIGLRFRPGELL